jgi:SAM-dependent methyltransferase
MRPSSADGSHTIAAMLKGPVEAKARVAAHWEAEPCGTRDLDQEDRAGFFAALSSRRYGIEPHIPGFADFARGRGRRVLEIGVGSGTDFEQWVHAGAIATGIDLTEAGVLLTRERLALAGLEARVEQGDAEQLSFPDGSFDIVYSYGVLHHTPDTERAVAEARRVLAPGGTLLLMLYHYPSWTALFVWGRKCLLTGRPWKRPRWAIAQYLESPGTKMYTYAEARRLLAGFTSVHMRTELTPMFAGERSEKYGTRFDAAAYAFGRDVVRPLISRFGRRWGLALLIEARKSASESG